jgi:type II secretory pathway component PulC
MASSGLQRRAASAVRPGVEAFLLAAVALGCAQVGWSVLTPDPAHGSSDSTSPDPSSTTAQLSEVRSPFAPAAGEMAGASHATQALLSSVRLSGVRMSEDAAQSGAVLTLEGGDQRAFLVGQEIAAGVRLEQVQPDYVLLSYEGGQRQVSMETAPSSFSFARALMGLPQETAQASAQAAVIASPQDAAWLASTLANLELAGGAAKGWRVSGPLPPSAATAGLRDGDLVVAVNGLGPDRAAQALGSLGSGRVVLSIERAGGGRVDLNLALNVPA